MQVDALYRQAAKAIHPKVTKAKSSQYYAHSLRVWACILLNKCDLMRHEQDDTDPTDTRPSLAAKISNVGALLY